MTIIVSTRTVFTFGLQIYGIHISNLVAVPLFPITVIDPLNVGAFHISIAHGFY
jgi:hypothetical protein